MTNSMFEGAEVVDFQAKLPAVTVACDDYKRGSILRLALEVRVKGVRYEENKDGGMTRVHVLGVEAIDVLANFDPSANAAAVGGSASGTPAQTPAGAAEIGLEIGRTSDAWPAQIVREEVPNSPDTTRVVDKSDGTVIVPDTSEVTESEIELLVQEHQQGPQSESEEEESKDLVTAASAADPGF